MASAFEGLSNIYQLNASIESLKNARSNTASYQQGIYTNQTDTSDPNSFLIKMNQDFNTMLNTLLSSPDDEKENSSSDIMSSLISNNTSTQSTANLQLLSMLEQNSALLGKEIMFKDATTGAEDSGVVKKIIIDQSSNPVFVLEDGSQIAITAVTGVKN